MTTKSGSLANDYDAVGMSSLKSTKQTEIVESSEEFPMYAHCKLPDHYFELLLAKKQQSTVSPVIAHAATSRMSPRYDYEYR